MSTRLDLIVDMHVAKQRLTGKPVEYGGQTFDTSTRIHVALLRMAVAFDLSRKTYEDETFFHSLQSPAQEPQAR